MFVEDGLDGGQGVGLSFHSARFTWKLTPSARAIKMEMAALRAFREAEPQDSNEAPRPGGQIRASATDYPERLVGLRRSFIGILDFQNSLRAGQVWGGPCRGDVWYGDGRVKDSMSPLRGGHFHLGKTTKWFFERGALYPGQVGPTSPARFLTPAPNRSEAAPR